MSLPSYKHPPLVEVVMGVQFDELHEFRAPYLWPLWENLGKDNFTKIDELAPLGKLEGEAPGAYILEKPDLPRFIFTSKDEITLCQAPDYWSSMRVRI